MWGSLRPTSESRGSSRHYSAGASGKSSRHNGGGGDGGSSKRTGEGDVVSDARSIDMSGLDEVVTSKKVIFHAFTHHKGIFTWVLSAAWGQTDR